MRKDYFTEDQIATSTNVPFDMQETPELKARNLRHVIIGLLIAVPALVAVGLYAC